MSELDSILDRIAERNQTLFELESAVGNTAAAVTWAYQGSTVLVRFGDIDGLLNADVTGWKDGEQTPLSVSDAFNTAVICMGTID